MTQRAGRHAQRLLILPLLLWATTTTFACGGGGDDPGSDAASGDAEVMSDAASGDAQPTPDGATPDAGPDCPADIICVDTFPYHDENDTSASPRDGFDAYDCMPGVDEGGPEIVYQVTIPSDGFLSAAVPDDVPGVDIDLHLLGSLDPADCIDRGNYDVGAHLTAGTYYLVADSWVDSGDVPLSGPYSLDIGFLAPPPGDCAMTDDVVPRLWGPDAVLPGTGPMVLEAHLVTVEDDFGGAWPTTITDGIPEHYATSYGLSGLVMSRDQPWCPQESSEFGQGATGAPVPGEGEAWYINMLWADRPAGGTRMIVQLPGGGPAVVAAAGYETGPGDTNDLAGVTEEIHFYLGTGHLDDMTIGFAADQTLPLGPIRCVP
ncbi:MAG: hypothetical protein ABI333_08630 [bacterium]